MVDGRFVVVEHRDGLFVAHFVELSGSLEHFDEDVVSDPVEGGDDERADLPADVQRGAHEDDQVELGRAPDHFLGVGGVEASDVVGQPDPAEVEKEAEEGQGDYVQPRPESDHEAFFEGGDLGIGVKGEILG